ncbi:MAG: hypothetical protein ACREAC_18350, partial [Blastocatellia bacterium]
MKILGAMVGFDIKRKLKMTATGGRARGRRGTLWSGRSIGESGKFGLLAIVAVVALSPLRGLSPLNGPERVPNPGEPSISLKMEDAGGRALLHFHTALMGACYGKA